MKATMTVINQPAKVDQKSIAGATAYAGKYTPRRITTLLLTDSQHAVAQLKGNVLKLIAEIGPTSTNIPYLSSQSAFNIFTPHVPYISALPLVFIRELQTDIPPTVLAITASIPTTDSTMGSILEMEAIQESFE